MKKSFLIIGDVFAILIVTIIGFATHGEAGLSFIPRMAAAFFPLVIAWFLLSPFLGLFQTEIISNPRQLWRPVLAMLFAGPFAAILRGILLSAPVIPIFAVVLSVTSAFGMLVWRGVYFLSNKKYYSKVSRLSSNIPVEIPTSGDVELHFPRDKITLMNEQALIQDAQGGNLEAFNTLILHYQDSVFNTALRILNDDDLAADATQDAFISAFKSINSYRGGSFKAWLMRTVTNACYDELRRQKRRPTTPLEPDTDDGEEMDSPRWLADPNMTPDQAAEADELEHAIQHCLNNLPLEFKSVVIMADIQGMDYTEVAVAVKVPLGTIKSRLARARLRLRECLQGFEELLPSSFRLEVEGPAQ